MAVVTVDDPGGVLGMRPLWIKMFFISCFSSKTRKNRVGAPYQGSWIHHYIGLPSVFIGH